MVYLELEVKTLIVEAYLNVLEALEREKIVRKNLNNINITLNQFKKIFEQGLIEEEILQQLQITKQSLNSSLEYTKKIIPITKQIFNISIGARKVNHFHEAGNVISKSLLISSISSLAEKVNEPS